MFFLEKKFDDPYFNLAMEEYVLRNFEEDIFMLWENPESLVVGKHQNPLVEIRPACLLQNSLPVIRRISGGGTVFHGKGNINFTFICNSAHGEDKVNFPKYLSPIINFLKTKGVDAEITGKNSLSVAGLKISGNAAHVFKNRSIHHGTLLFDAGLDRLDACLANENDHYHSRAVASVRASVTNIQAALAKKTTQNQFEMELKNFVLTHFGFQGQLMLSPKHMADITDLAHTKYRSDEWTYGYSPDYSLLKTIATPLFSGEVSLQVKKGLIEKVTIDAANYVGIAHQLVLALQNQWHIPSKIFQIINTLPFAEQMGKSEREQLTLQLF